jgi:hypothetical protein
MKQTLISQNSSNCAAEETKLASSSTSSHTNDASKSTQVEVVVSGIPPVVALGSQEKEKTHRKFQHGSLPGPSQEELDGTDTPDSSSIQGRPLHNAAKATPSTTHPTNDGSVTASVSFPTAATSRSRSSSKRSASSTTTAVVVASTRENASCSSARPRFPDKLHRLLEQCSDDPNESRIVSWVSDRAFKVHEPKQFASIILPRYFSTTTYKSFQRNLNLW